jgi:nitroreductase
MDVLKAITSRRSIHKFKDIPVPKDILVDMFVAGQYAPSAGNLQPCQFIVVDDEDLKDVVADACYNQDWMKSAPVFIIVICNSAKIESQYGNRGDMYAIQSAAALTQNMLLVATTHGIGTCWVGAFNGDKILDVLGVPPGFTVQSVIPLGYPAESVPTPPRLSLFDTARLNKFGFFGKLADQDWLEKNYAPSIHKSVKRGAKNLRNSVRALFNSREKK